MKIAPILKMLVKKDGSDVYLTTGASPITKINGKMVPLSKESFPPGYIETLAMELMDDEQKAQWARKPEMNLGLSLSGVGRFRVNIYKQRSEVSMVIRNIKTEIPDFDELGLPESLKETVLAKRGLILFVGSTGSGKSTSLAALIDHRNTHSSGNIITIEDPIEFVHKHKGCLVNQREIGIDTDCYADALKNALRQAPDVVLIGEIRDRETMEHALTFSETGHLVISTLHANNANQAFDRIVNFFPEEKRQSLLRDLSLNLKAFVSQRLIPTRDGKLCAAIEVLMNSPRIATLIREGDTPAIKEAMFKSESVGMQTFDSALYNLYVEGRITKEEALRNADGVNDLLIRIENARSGKKAAAANASSDFSSAPEESGQNVSQFPTLN